MHNNGQSPPERLSSSLDIVNTERTDSIADSMDSVNLVDQSEGVFTSNSCPLDGEPSERSRCDDRRGLSARDYNVLKE